MHNNDEVLVNDTHRLPATRLENGRNHKLTSWFQQWSAPMRRWAASHSSVSTDDLDDVAQEAFLRLLRYGDETLIQYPQTYLFRIASNVANEWRDRAKNKRPHQDAWLEELQVEPDDEPENILARKLVSERVQEAVARLPQRQREVLLLHINDSLTCVQIAKRLRLTRRIVRRDLAHAYAQLRCDLELVRLDE